MAGLSSAQFKTIEAALKRANTRIARLEDAFGRSSSTFKNQTSAFEKGALNKYVGESASGHWKLDISKIKNDIKSGKLNYDQANEILVRSSGLKISGSGEVKPTSYSEGFKTVQGTLLETLDSIQTGAYDLSSFQDANGFIEINKKTLKEITEQLNAISESFQTEYEDSPLDAKTMKSDPILSKLYSSENGGTREKGTKLSYTELQEISNQLARIRSEFDKERLQGKETSDFLKNKPGE